jgi:hypothetical protein
MKASPIQTNFNSGEVSPALYGRVDVEFYKSALATCLNCLPLVEGPVTRRPGSYHAANVKNSNKQTRLVRFKPSDTEAYVVEVGDRYFRFYKNNGQVLLSGSPYEIATPYLETDIFELNVDAQSADVLYITHPSYAPRKLMRFGDTKWTLEIIDFLDGPYGELHDNLSNVIQLSPSAATGAITITATTPGAKSVTGAVDNGAGLIRITVNTALLPFFTGATAIIAGVTGTTEANGTWTVVYVDSTHLDLVGSVFVNAYIAGGTVAFSFFAATDVGRLIRLREGSTWGYVKITGYTDPITVSATVINTLTNNTPKYFFRMGVWSGTTGYPSAAAFYEDRLVFGSNTQGQQRIDGSRTGAYEDFTPSDTDGTVAADHAYSFNLNSDDVQVVKWLKNDEKALFVGTGAGEWPLRPSTSSEAISPTNINAKQSTAFGSADVPAIKTGKGVLFVQKYGRKLRRMAFNWEADGFSSQNLTRLAGHITKGATVATSGIKNIAWQQSPQPYVWAIREDGALLALLYDEDEKVMGWSRHTLGGYSNAGHTSPAVVEALAVIPSQDGSRDEVWLVVRRYINGVAARSVEYLTKAWDEEDAIEDSVYLDCAKTYDGAPTTTITGLTYLIGETVSVLADGAEHPDVVVNGSGEITLNRSASVVQVGYRYNSDGQTLRQEAGAADGTAQGKTNRPHRVAFRFRGTGPVKIGSNFNSSGYGKLTPLPLRVSTDDTATAVPLFSGDKSIEWEADYAMDNSICWRWNSALPGTLLAIMPQLHTQDR